MVKDLCKGCTHCIKRCPTQAIRITKGKANIINERCIDCGECIRHCPYGAKKAKADELDDLKKYKYTIALPAPALYGQFGKMMNADFVLTALLDIGFDSIFEVASAAELVAGYSQKLMDEKKAKGPVISSACPAVVRLVRTRYPDLCDYVLPVISPMQAAGRMAKEEAILKTGLSKNEIGVFFITPCPAKITDVHQPLIMKQTWVDGALAISEIYPKLLDAISRIETPQQLMKSGNVGIQWARSGGEASSIQSERYLAADGMENIMSVLDALEEERLGDLDFVELNACPGGCVGGVLTVENPYLAKAKIQGMIRQQKSLDPQEVNYDNYKYLNWNLPLTDADVMRLSASLQESLYLMNQIDEVHKKFPDLDCGFCGAPTCRALAEDVVLTETAAIDDCIFLLKEQAMKEKEEREKQQ